MPTVKPSVGAATPAVTLTGLNMVHKMLALGSRDVCRRDAFSGPRLLHLSIPRDRL